MDNKLATLERDNAFLTEHVIRLSKELSRYQNSNTSEESVRALLDEGLELPPDVSTVSPIFASYDMRIEELGNLIEQQGSYLDTLTERSQELLSENEALRKRAARDIEKLSRQRSSDRIQDSLVKTNSGDALTAVDKNSKQWNDLTEENDLLCEQAELLAKELERANQTISSRDKNIEQLNKQVKTKLDLIEKFECRVNQLTRDQNTYNKELNLKDEVAKRHSVKIKELEDHVVRATTEKSELISKFEDVTAEKQEYELEAEELSRKVSCIGIFNKI